MYSKLCPLGPSLLTDYYRCCDMWVGECITNCVVWLLSLMVCMQTSETEPLDVMRYRLSYTCTVEVTARGH